MRAVAYGSDGKTYEVKVKTREIRVDYQVNSTNRFSFLEPVVMELKLTNSTAAELSVDEDCLADGQHVAIVVKRDGGITRKWRPFQTYCHILVACVNFRPVHSFLARDCE